MRRISTKLVVAVLAAVVLPFVALTAFINHQIGDRVTRHVAQQALLGLAKDLAGRLDAFVEERREDVVLWADAPLTNAAIDDYLVERARLRRVERGEGAAAEVPSWGAALVRRATLGESTVHAHHVTRWQLTSELDRYVELKLVYDLLLVVAADGRLVTCSSRGPDGEPLDEASLARLFATDFSGEPWFRGAMQGEIRQLDQHVSPYRLAVHEDPARNHHLGFAAPIVGTSLSHGPRGVLFALVNWKHVQDAVSEPVLKDAFRGLVSEEREPSPYAWIWASDADTILAHPNRELYHASIVRDVGLPQMTDAVLDSATGYGLYPEYRFQGADKNAAFKRTRPPEAGGFDWVVGVGIDNEDIYATAGELQRLLLWGTLLVLAMATLWTFVIARRTTRPIHELQRYTRRVAEGDLDAQVAIGSRDELGELADDFNVMTRELKEQRDRLVKAEKDAAWREMARQIAHDIKNPLTPISLSLDLLERVRREDAAGSEEILERTMGLMRRQVGHLRQIAGDFYEFTGGRRPKSEIVDVAELLGEVLHLHDAWAVELGVAVQREGRGALVRADRGKLQRVFVNLVSNALQSMPEGGRLDVETAEEDGRVRVSIRDTGHGIPAEARAHLFEPYFTTKSEGTGLGLAISKRVVEESGGTIELRAAPDDGGGGTVAVVRLPLVRGGGADGGGGGA